jgi:hypothetical protein
MGLHMALGAIWLGFLLAWARRPSRGAWRGMMGCAIAALWYLPFGTLLSALQIALLWRWAAKVGRDAGGR